MAGQMTASCSSKIPSFRMLLFFIFFITVSVIQGVATSRSTPFDSKSNRTFASDTEFRPENLSSKEERKKKDSKREMIGSVAPTCTFNECRGCKYNKCRAEQVPVEGNDPMNSPYHYKCVAIDEYLSIYLSSRASHCRAEQVPVEGNDPMNSPYHYKCVCHR